MEIREKIKFSPMVAVTVKSIKILSIKLCFEFFKFRVKPCGFHTWRVGEVDGQRWSATSCGRSQHWRSTGFVCLAVGGARCSVPSLGSLVVIGCVWGLTHQEGPSPRTSLTEARTTAFPFSKTAACAPRAPVRNAPPLRSGTRLCLQEHPKSLLLVQ